MMETRTLIQVVREAWGWTGLEPAEILAENAFGNVIVRSVDGRIWRICPEGLECKPVAENVAAFETLRKDPDFEIDWRMDRLVAMATELYGQQPSERCFCLKLNAVLGGKYEAGNLGTITRTEVLDFAGYIANQIRDLPDGSKVILTLKKGSKRGDDAMRIDRT